MSAFWPNEDNPLNGWHFFGIISLFFVTIIIVNFTMAFFATSTFPGLVVENSYVASQNYNKWLEASRAQDARGWDAKFDTSDGILTVDLRDKSGAPISGLNVSAIIGRASDWNEDRLVMLQQVTDGYRADEPLGPGRWMVELKVRSGEDLVFRTTEPVMVNSGPAS
ncbi:FixH family protein [Afifella marina]|nr:FixH family protein [Afifella marina]